MYALYKKKSAEKNHYFAIPFTTSGEKLHTSALTMSRTERQFGWKLAIKYYRRTSGFWNLSILLVQSGL